MTVETTHIGSLEDITQDTQSDVSEVEQKVDEHIANEQNPHGVDTGQIGAATQSAVDSLSSDVNDHVSDGSNPHGTSAYQVGAIPDSNGEVSQSHLSFSAATASDLDNHVSASNPHNVGLSDASEVDTAVHIPDGGRFEVIDNLGNVVMYMTDISGPGFYSHHPAEISGELSLTNGGNNGNGRITFANGDVWLTADSYYNAVLAQNTDDEEMQLP